MKLTNLRVGLRLARRELRRQPGRAALVVLMIVIPTAAATAVCVFERTGDWSVESQRRANMGAAQARADFSGSQPPSGVYPGLAAVDATSADIQRLRDAFPPATRIDVERSAIDRVRTSTKSVTVFVTDVNLRSRLQRGRYTISAGRPAATSTEAAITSEVAQELGLKIGSTFSPERVGHSLVVVGLVKVPQGYGGTALVFARDVPPRAQTTALIDAPPRGIDIPGWGASGWVWNSGSHTDGVLWSYVGASVGLFVVGVIVAAAFALGARRQLRTIGLLSSSGASPRVVAATLATQGFVAGTIGAVAGVGLGLAGVHALPRHVLYSLTNQDVHAPVARTLDLLPIIVLGVAAATIAAWFPARTASRLPTLQALASRRPAATTPARRAWFWSAGALALSGALIAFGDVSHDSAGHRLALVAGFVLPLVAALWVAPIAVRALERGVTDRPLAWRLAGRSLARNGTRTSSVVGATCAVIGVVVGGATLIASWDSGYDDALRNVPFIRDNQALLESSWQFQATEDGQFPEPTYPLPPIPDIDASYVRRLHDAVPRASVVPLLSITSAGGHEPAYQFDRSSSLLYSGYGSSPIVALATPELLDVFRVPPRLRQLGAIVIAPRDGPVPQRETGHVGRGDIRIHIGAVVRSDEASLGLPRVLLNSRLLKRFGWRSQFSGTVALVAKTPFTARARRHLDLLTSDIAWSQDLREPAPPGASYVQTSLTVGTGPYHVTDHFPVHAAGFGAACVLVLAVVAIGLVLNARDSDDERAVLEATGVVPRVRRQIGTRKAALIVLTGAAIAIPVSLIPIAVLVTTSDNHAATFRPDWLALAAMAIGLPLVVSGVTAAGGFARDAFRPRRAVVLVED